MKLVIPNKLLTLAVNFVESASKDRSLPILSHLLFTIKDNFIGVTGSDLEVELTYVILRDSDGVEAEDGAFTLPTQKLKKLIKAGPRDSVVTFESKKGPQGEQTDDFTMRFSGLRSKYLLKTLPSTDYPDVELDKKQMTYFKTDAENFIQSLETILPVIPQQDVRYYLNGAEFTTANGKLVLNATDGHRLTQNRVDYTPVNEDKKDFQGIIPHFTAMRLSSVLKGIKGEITAGVGARHFYIKVQTPDGYRVMKSQLIDGKYPDVERVIPKQSAQQVEVNLVELTQACRRAAILANEKVHGVRFTFDNNTLILEADNPENEQAKEYVDIKGEGYVDLGFNVDYFLAALGCHNAENISIGLTDNLTSITITSESKPDLVNVVMPMRL